MLLQCSRGPQEVEKNGHHFLSKLFYYYSRSIGLYVIYISYILLLAIGYRNHRILIISLSQITAVLISVPGEDHGV